MRYNFIEIGTSDFDTLLQKSSDTTIGLSVEPLKHYLERLPNKPGVTKVNAALSNTDDYLEIYNVPVSAIEKYNLPYWVRGCNSLSKPHQYTMDSIGVELYNQIVQIDRVATITWKTLISQYNVESVEFIKIDTEGHEYIILKDYFEMCKNNPLLYADKIMFEYNENSDMPALDRLVSSVDVYDFELCGFDMVLTKKKVVDRAYVLYATPSYINTVQGCVNSIKTFSNVPVMVYMLNSDLKVEGANTINWKCDVEDVKQNEYIDRKDARIYNILINRPLVVKDALSRANIVAYIDADSVATDQIDNIFSYFDESSVHPYFVEGVYNYLMVDGNTDIERPILELFDVQRKEMYRQTGYFVSGQGCIKFLDEWWDMCNHPQIKASPAKYAPFHEETIANLLLWKNNYDVGLPYIYVNGGLDRIDEIYFTGQDNLIREWVKIPASKDRLLFFHGEKNKDLMMQMINKLDQKLRILFLAPHLSTGGMPAFLLKRIEALEDSVNIYVVEHSDLSPDYIVQKEQIKKLVKNFWTLGENKLELIDVIKNNNIDVVHIDDVSEALDQSVARMLFREDRTWRIVETCHNVAFNPDRDKIWYPDAYAFCTPYHEKTFANVINYSETIEFPIDAKSKYPEKTGIVLNVGLWTPGKNQAEGLEIARNNPDLEFYFVGNQAPNFQEYWKPLMKNLPENVTVWGERSDVSEFMKKADVFMFNSTWECNPLVLREAISYGLPIIAHNLPQYGDMFTKYIQPIDTDLNTIQANYTIPTDNTSDIFGSRHLSFYKTVKTIPIVKQKVLPNKVNINQHFIEQPFLEITGNSDAIYHVKFYDENNNLYHQDRIKTNHWVRLNRRYYTKWRTEVWENDTLIYKNILNLSNKKVFISFDSSSLGDNIAWMPYCLEFKKKHNCHVIVSTFKNFLFKDVYPEIEFVEPGSVVPNIYAQYKIGWFYNSDSEPALPNTVNLQKCATNILGLDYQEIRPRISYQVGNNLYGKYVTIATNSTSGCKFWTKEGWQEVINHLVDNGYSVINVSKEGNFFNNCSQIEDSSMENTMNIIHHSEFFIGLSSGLSWLAWALNKQVVMISNFTEDDHEFECIRITNKNVCHGCWNNPNFKFDKGDWNWCPIYKNTNRQFECHKLITSSKVIDEIKKVGI